MATASSDRLGRPLGTGRDWRRRLLLHHVPIAIASALVLVVLTTVPLFADDAGNHTADISSGPLPQERAERGSMDHAIGTGSMGHGGDGTGSRDHGEMGGRSSYNQPLTVATGYVATGLLALSLLVGPANLLLRRRNPVSNFLARDVGMWAAIVSVVHVFFALDMEGGLRGFAGFFVAPDGSPLTNSFGLGNWVGLAATAIVVGLLALSNNTALRKLKARRWKRLQRLNYALFALVVLHAFFYGGLVEIATPFTLLLAFTVIAVLVGQAVGIWLWRRRHRSTKPLIAI